MERLPSREPANDGNIEYFYDSVHDVSIWVAYNGTGEGTIAALTCLPGDQVSQKARDMKGKED